MVRASDTTAIESLQKRFKTRVALGLSLARAYRFVAELEPSPGDGPDPFADLALVFRDWRRALRNDDADAALDAVERSWTLLEACRERVTSRDAAIEAYRVRWACENAPLHHQTIDSLARFYRLLPFSLTPQSKNEYVRTRPPPGRCWNTCGLVASTPRSASSAHAAATSFCFESYAGRPGPRRSSTIAATPHSAMPQAVGHFHTD